MAINIAQDLDIKVSVNSISTQTLNNIYDTGGNPEDYLPGKDFSPIDDVSTGNVTSYQVGIALTSKSNQTYTIDKLFLQSIDNPKTNGTGIIPLYYINTDPNPQNTIDDGQNTLVANYNANMISVVFDQNAGVTSNSTVTLTLYVNYPDGIYWKTKIAPNIRAVAVKDGIQKLSDAVKFEEVKMSSTADIQNDFYRSVSEWQGIRLTTNNGVKGFYVPFYMTTSELPLPNINQLLDSPNANPITYTADLNFTIDGTVIPITNPNISISIQSGTGITIQSASVSSNKYTVVLQNSGDIAFPIVLRSSIFLPYDPGSKANVTMNMTGVWNGAGVTWNNWINEYIFSESTVGGINASQVIPLIFTNPATLSNDVSSYIQPPNTNIDSNFYFSNLDFMSMAGSKMMLLYDSKVSYISDANKFLEVRYFNLTTGMIETYDPLPTDYIQQYGYVDLPVGYDANTICQSVLNGNVTLGTYQDIVNTGKIPNVLMTTIVADVLAGLNVDYSQSVSISYQKAKTSIISNTDFETIYQNNPSADYTSYLYTSMLIGTNFLSVAAADAKYGTSLALNDKFVSINGKVYLDLATVTKGQPGNLTRFEKLSIVRANITVPTYRIKFQTSITDDNKNTITTIADYSATYNLRFFVQSPLVDTSVPGTFLAGTVINLAVPSNILPYIYIANDPGIYKTDPNFQVPILVNTITNYSLSNGGISVTIPSDVTFYNDGNNAVYLSIPVKFILPSQNQVFNHQNTNFDLSKLILAYPNQIVTGFGANTPYFIASVAYVNTTLQGAGVNFTGLTVNKNYYQNGTEVNYIASVKNITNPTDNIYMSMTVPTNKYNPLETSNNTQQAFINNITTFDPNTILYYQTATNATAADIAAMKEINQQGTNISVYYNTVVVNNWVKYTNGNPLPNDVVMMVAYTPNVPEGTIVRVDYVVKVEMDVNTTNVYTNDAAFNYYSSSSNLESQSNKVTIQNYLLVNNIVINKSPLTQNVEGVVGGTAMFTIIFDVPQIAAQYQSLTFIDQLPKALTLLPTSTLQIGNNVAVPLDATISASKLVTKSFIDMSQIAGKTITIILMTNVDQPNNVPVSLLDINQASLIINSDPLLVSNSNIVDVVFKYTNLFNIRKQPLTQNHPKTVGEPVEFGIFFDVPQDISTITSMTITDILAPSLSYDPVNSLLQIGTSSVEPLNATVSGQNITIDFTKILEAFGQTVKITLGTKLTDITALPVSDTIENNATLIINNIAAYNFVSNTVNATFGNKVLPIAITKAPITQTVKKIIDEKVPFTLSFTIPQNIQGYNNIMITDTLNESLIYSAADSTIQYGSSPSIALSATVSGNTVTVNINSLTGLEGENVVITLVGIVNDLSVIPQNNQITNVATLVVNNNETISSTSNTVTAIYAPVVLPISVTKAPLTQTVKKAIGEKVPFTLNFTIPQDITGYNALTITDILNSSLIYSAVDSTIQFGTNVPTALNATVSGNTVNVNINSLTGLAGEKVVITLVGIVNDLSVIPQNNQITNVATMVVNNDGTISSISNPVTVIYQGAVPIVITKTPLAQIVKKAIGEKVPFTLNFTIPQDITVYNSLTMIDTLDSSLTYSAIDSTIQFGTNVPTALNATVSGNIVTVNINNLTGHAGEKVVILLVGIVNDLSTIPQNNEIPNIAKLTVNNDETISVPSNPVTAIYKPVVLPIAITKTPLTQIVKKAVGEKVPFTLNFTIPQNIEGYNSITVTDVLNSSLIYSAIDSTIQVGTNAPTALNASVSGNTVTININSLTGFAGENVVITLVGIVNDLSIIPQDNQITNVATLAVNNDGTISSTSNVANVIFTNKVLPITIAKAPATQTVEKAIGEKVPFTLNFTIPQDITGYNTLTITDILDASLIYSAIDSTIQYGANAPTALNASVSGNTITVNINSLTGFAGENVVITLVGIVNNLSAIPQNNQIINFATLTVNGDGTISTPSNVVNVIFTNKVLPIAITKAPLTQTIRKVIGQKVPFTLNFTIPQDITGYSSLTITDILNSSLIYSAIDSTIQFGTNAPTALNASVSGNTVTVNVNSLTGLAGENVVITLVGIVNNLSAIPQNNQITNVATMVVNNDGTLGSTSNVANVIFSTGILPIAITKAPLTQTIQKVIGQKVPFTLNFTIPQDITEYSSLTITDVLNPSLIYSAIDSTIQFGTNAPTALNASVSGNTVTVNVNSLTGLVGKNVVITLVGIVNNLSVIPQNNQITNIATLTVNGDGTISSTSNAVTVNFESSINLIELTKSVNERIVKKQNGEQITFYIKFKMPTDTTNYTSIVITDTIHESIQYLPANSTIQYGVSAPTPLNATAIGNTIKIIITNFTGLAGQNVLITLTCEVLDVTKVPLNNLVTNNATLVINQDESLKTISNTVVIALEDNNATNLIIASIGFEELALSHILNAEGEKIQSFLGTLEGQTVNLNPTLDELLQLDNMVNDTIKTVIKEELILLMKLEEALKNLNN